MSMSNVDRIRRELEEAIEVSLLRTPVDVIIMGPGLAEESEAADLRRELIRLASGFGAVVKPEHDQLVAAAEGALGEGHSLTAYEMHLVSICHLVVIIPASAGSLCELGLFSGLEHYAKKLLVLVSAEFPRSGSYVADGPLTIARQHRGEVCYVNYDRPEEVWPVVRARIEQLKVTKSLAKLTDSAGSR